MTIETKNNNTIITIPNSINFAYLQDFLDYLNVKTIVSKSKATTVQIKNLSEKSQEDWWNKNKNRFVE